MKNKIEDILKSELYVHQYGYMGCCCEIKGWDDTSDLILQLMCDITMDLMTDVTTFTYAKRRMLKHGFDPVQIEKSIEKLKY